MNKRWAIANRLLIAIIRGYWNILINDRKLIRCLKGISRSGRRHLII